MRLEISSIATKHIQKKQKKKTTIFPPQPTHDQPSNQLANQLVNSVKTKLKEFFNMS